MIHHSFSDLSVVVEAVLPELPGAFSAVVLPHAIAIAGRFCEHTMAYVEEVEFSVSPSDVGASLVSPHDGSIVIGMKSLMLDGRTLEPGDYVQNSPSEITFVHSVSAESSATALLILKPRIDSSSLPSSIVDRWADCLASGVKARMMAMPKQEWSDPQMALYYSSEYERAARQAAADVRNEFDVSRKGRGGFARSVWEV